MGDRPGRGRDVLCGPHPPHRRAGAGQHDRHRTALNLALDLLEGKPGRRIIDISGDGPDNVDWFLGVWAQRERARTLWIEMIPTAEEPKVDLYYAQNVITDSSKSRASTSTSNARC